MNGAQLILRLLEERGVEVCFGLPGVHNLPLWEALRDSPIRLIGVRHEQAAAYAADGFARASGKLGVALTTTGPGAANTLAAVGEAWASRSPVLVIATDIPSGLRRPGTYRGVLHETTDQAAMFAPVTKSTHRALAPELVAPAAAAAIAEAVAEPSRPVYLEIATDLLGAEVPDAAPEPRATDLPTADGELDAAVARLAAAERPLIWVGGGARDAGRRSRGSPSGWRRRSWAPTAPRACSRRRTRAWSACRRTWSPPDGCGTTPTWSWRSAPTSTACRPRTSPSRSRRR